MDSNAIQRMGKGVCNDKKIKILALKQNELQAFQSK